MRYGEDWLLRKTGNRDKKSIIDSIKLLEKAGLLNTKKTPEHK
jgi:hypothetical protein